jgi:hypothetical protein
MEGTFGTEKREIYLIFLAINKVIKYKSGNKSNVDNTKRRPMLNMC